MVFICHFPIQYNIWRRYSVLCQTLLPTQTQPPPISPLHLTVGPHSQSPAREPGQFSNYHYLGRRGALLALLCYCTV